jgi:hypothetical protein
MFSDLSYRELQALCGQLRVDGDACRLTQDKVVLQQYLADRIDGGYLQKDMRSHCALQHEYRGVITNDTSIFQNHTNYRRVGHELPFGTTYNDFDRVQHMYKTTYFSEMNTNLIYRGGVVPFRDGYGRSRYNVTETIYYLHDNIFIFLQGILDGPRYTRPFICYRSLGRMSQNSNHYAVGTVLPISSFLSTGLVMSTSDADNVDVLKIHVPAGHPALFFYRGCMDDNGGLETSEVILPYTLDNSGKTLSHGLRVISVENDKPFLTSTRELKFNRRLITVEIVRLDTAIPLKPLANFEEFKNQPPLLLEMADLDPYKGGVYTFRETYSDIRSSKEQFVNCVESWIGKASKRILKIFESTGVNTLVEMITKLDNFNTMMFNNQIVKRFCTPKQHNILFSYLKLGKFLEKKFLNATHTVLVS